MGKHARQLALLLRERNGWGGRREGAGRKPGAVRRDPHRKRAPLEARFPCLVTLKVRADVTSLRSVRFVREGIEMRVFAAAITAQAGEVGALD